MLSFIGLLLLFLSDLLLLLVLALLLFSVLLCGFLLLLDIFLCSLLLSFDGSLGIFLSLVSGFGLLAALFIKSILNSCSFSTSASSGGTCGRRAWNSRVASASWAKRFLHLAHKTLDGLGITTREFKVSESTVGADLGGSIGCTGCRAWGTWSSGSCGRGLVNPIE